jgi:hypothetical protein
VADTPRCKGAGEGAGGGRKKGGSVVAVTSLGGSTKSNVNAPRFLVQCFHVSGARQKRRAEIPVPISKFLKFYDSFLSFRMKMAKHCRRGFEDYASKKKNFRKLAS